MPRPPPPIPRIDPALTAHVLAALVADPTISAGGLRRYLERAGWMSRRGTVSRPVSREWCSLLLRRYRPRVVVDAPDFSAYPGMMAMALTSPPR